MKIEGNNIDNVQGQTTERAGQGDAKPPARKSDGVNAPSTDEVRLSPEIQLVQEAAQAAAAMPEIRQDVVEKMRAELEAGRIGNDPHKLADALIDSWVKEQ